MTLVVDVGTNAEIVLGDRRRLLAASSPTGPAFEGAQISGGQRAAPGAIERVRIDRDDARAALPGHRRRRLVGRARASPRPPRETGVTGICGSGIIEVIAELFLAGVITADGVVDGALAARTPRIVAGRPDVQLRPPRGRADGPRIVDHPERRPGDPAGQGRALRRRPAADGPRSAIDAVDEIRLAGAFGSQIDPIHAMVLGLDPRLRPRPRPVGRQRGRDRRAHRAAVGRRRREIEGVVRRVEKIETAVEPRFQEHFVEAMAFPHRTAAVPEPGRASSTLPDAAGDRRPAASDGARRATTPARRVAVGTKEDD